MKQFTMFALLAVLGTATTFAQKFGHLDAQAVLLELPERADAQATIEGAAAEYEGEIARMQQDLETKYAEYQAKVSTWPDAIRQQKEVELQRMDKDLQQLGMTIQNELAQMEQQLLSPMIDRVRKAIEEVGAEQGFTYIFDTSTGVTLYNGGQDVTDLVKTKLGM